MSRYPLNSLVQASVMITPFDLAWVEPAGYPDVEGTTCAWM